MKTQKNIRYKFIVFMIATLMVIAVTFKPSTSEAQEDTFHVSVNGNDANAGTESYPWRTVQHAANSAQAGDTVLVHGGEYQETVVFTHSGNSNDGFITFKNYGSEVPILDGSTFPANAPHDVLHINDKAYLRIEGFEIRDFQSSGQWITVVGIRVTGSSNNIELINNHIHHLEADAVSKADALGIAVYGTSETTPSQNITIADNHVHDLKLGFSESVVVSGNVDGFTIQNNYIHDNDNIGIDAVGRERWLFCDDVDDPSCVDIADNYARNGVISDNIVHGIDASANPAYTNPNTGLIEGSAPGIYVDGGAHIVIERNLVYDNDFGISVSSENAGFDSSYVTVRNNLIYRNKKAGIVTGSSNPDPTPTSINPDNIPTGGASNNQFVNNTLYHNGIEEIWVGEFWFQHDVRDTLVKNNIIFADNDGLFVTKYQAYALPINTVLDHNLYYFLGSENDSRWDWESNGNYTVSFDNWKQVSGYDANSLFINPLFVDASTFDFHLQDQSPAIDAGIATNFDSDGDYEGNSRIVGTSIDIGAYEFVSQQNTLPEANLERVVEDECRTHGWAFDPDFSSQSIQVELRIDDNYTAQVTADVSRQDVNTHFDITGNHGFQWFIPEAFRDGQDHILYATVINVPNGPNAEAKHSGLVFNCPADNTPPKANLERVIEDECRTHGWAFDPDFSSQSIQVELRIDDNYTAQVTADVSRQDVNTHFDITGNHGFQWFIPEAFRDGQDHILYATVINVPNGPNTEAKHSGRTFNCPVTNYLNLAPIKGEIMKI